MLERGFLLFWFFFYFFRNFLARVEYERNSGLKFFPLFLRLSDPILARNNARKGFFNFLIFFLFFSQFSCSSRVWTEFGSKIFFFSFSAYLISFWLKIISESGFLIFFKFLGIFLEFSCLGRVWTEFGCKIFFLSFSAYLIPFWLKKMSERGF